jgi:membrane dipeptidase
MAGRDKRAGPCKLCGMPEAAELHERLFTIDTHIDTPTASMPREGWDFGAAHDVAVDGSQCDLPRMRAGGLDAAFLAIYTAQGPRTPEGFTAARERAIHLFKRTHQIVRQNSAACGLALMGADAIRLKSEGRRAIYFSLENAYPMGLDIRKVVAFQMLGMRMMGLTHMLNNDIADSSTDPRGPEWGGLSILGRSVVEECNRLGVVIDGSHASDETVWQLLKYSTAPIILSHSGCRAVCDHPRNVGDDLLRALADKGGVIQINALPAAVVPVKEDGRTAAIADMVLRIADKVPSPEARAWASGEWARIEQAYPNPQVTMDDYVRHIEHAVNVAGIEHVGIGCDFDGGGGFPGLNSVADYPNLTAALLKRGWSEMALTKLWGGNTFRLLG